MIGLALGGGGVKGSYEIGAYMAFKKCHIKFDGIVGTSIGSFNAAMIVAGKEKELLSFWQHADVGKILGLNKKYVDKVNLNEKDFELLKLKIDVFIETMKNKGVSTDGLEEVLKNFDLEKTIRKRNMDYGLSTFRINDQKPLDLFIEDMPNGSLDNYIIASCYFPVFTPKKLENDSYYFDGGIYNNCPYNMLLKKGYDKVYAIDLKAIGFREKILDESKVTIIRPSGKLSGIFSVSKDEINHNLQMGYYDTLKVLKNLDGYKYIFKKKPNFYYDFLIRKVPRDLKERVKALYKTTDSKEMIIKALETLMISNKETYFNIYKVRKLIRKYKKISGNSTAHKFISYLR